MESHDNGLQRARAEGLVSIGRLAEATGISPDRLRIWERRYGRPRPVRLASGHRRYPAEEVARLRCVADLLARGRRPGELLALDDEGLDALHLELTTVGPAFPELETWIDWTLELREVELVRAIEEAARDRPLLDFLAGRLTPFLVELGTRWAAGRLDVRHEHFAARLVEANLAKLREALPDPVGAPSLLFATLPDELHGIPLRMLGLLAAEAGVPHVMLGVDTPVEEIASAARQRRVAAVVLSVSLAHGGPSADRALRELRDVLPDEIELVAGGSGVTGRGPRGVNALGGLEDFVSWLGERGARRGSVDPALAKDGSERANSNGSAHNGDGGTAP